MRPAAFSHKPYRIVLLQQPGVAAEQKPYSIRCRLLFPRGSGKGPRHPAHDRFQETVNPFGMVAMV